MQGQPPMLGADLAGEVSTPQPYVVEPEGPPGLPRFTVVAFDLGIKTNTPRNFARRGIRSYVLPSSASFDQVADINPHGVFLSNGPVTRRPRTTSSPSPAKCWAPESRCSVSVSAIRSWAARWDCQPTRWSSVTAGSTSR
ncbi:putative carbamoyl-phosphate synthase, small subunit [Mycobacterium kansasii]|uniref:Putative carbamoyl-phosphate synthase, small subunit n=1 Tax=Mycobacterium kansasii TaxID=1768 RepID=A0A1V3WDM9_MYCKA|nr:putative carbamoyl-phosphate synthase, small subunit [Mycobacterium kansasii]